MNEPNKGVVVWYQFNVETHFKLFMAEYQTKTGILVYILVFCPPVVTLLSFCHLFIFFLFWNFEAMFLTLVLTFVVDVKLPGAAFSVVSRFCV